MVRGGRIERAKDLLHLAQRPPIVIAQAVGVSDQSHGTSTVRRETGITPAPLRFTATA